MMIYSGHQDQRWGPSSYSQHGDDFMLLNLFELLNLTPRNYLDLGAHHPYNISNTALLYQHGFRGINAEANPELIEAFYKERPEDQNLKVGIGLVSGMRPFYMYGNSSGRNTFSLKETETLKDQMRVSKVIDLPVITLNELVNQYCKGIYPSLLCSDLEGLDFDVLESADFTSSHPALIVVETRRIETEKMTEMLTLKGFHRYCRMGENLFFIASERFEEAF